MYVGIYGFEFGERIKIESAGLELIPISKTHQEIKSLAKDKQNFNLTGFMEVAEKRSRSDEEKIWEISSLLTFCQQQWVIVSYNPVESVETLPQKLKLSQYRTCGCELLSFDKSKEKLLNLLYEKLQDNEFLEKTDFKTAFYRNVELWRFNLFFEEINYYFCLSGIEALARCKFDYYGPGRSAELITKLLKGLEFDVTQDESEKSKEPLKKFKAIQNFLDVRNALFHYGGKSNLKDFEDPIMRLFPDVLLKVVEFEDEHINWNRWQDLMG